jgi:hypothetical protein
MTGHPDLQAIGVISSHNIACSRERELYDSANSAKTLEVPLADHQKCCPRSCCLAYIRSLQYDYHVSRIKGRTRVAFDTRFIVLDVRVNDNVDNHLFVPGHLTLELCGNPQMSAGNKSCPADWVISVIS